MIDDCTLTFCENPKANMEVKETYEESPISRLNDDCLIKVFNKLSPEDRVLVEQGIYEEFYNNSQPGVQSIH